MSDPDDPWKERESLPSDEASSNPINPYAAPVTISETFLQPFPTIGSVLAQGLTIWVQNWVAIVTVIGVTWFPMEVLNLVADYDLLGPVSDTFSWAIYVVQFAVDAFVTAVLLFIAMAAAAGKPTAVGPAMRSAAGVWGRFVLTYLLLTVLMMIGFVFLVIPGLFLSVALSLTESVIVKEGVGGFAAIRRSYELSMKRFWRLAGLCFVLLLLLLIPWVIYVIGMLTFPGMEFWQLSLTFSVFIDVLDTYPTVCLYLAYRQLADQRL